MCSLGFSVWGIRDVWCCKCVACVACAFLLSFDNRFRIKCQIDELCSNITQDDDLDVLRDSFTASGKCGTEPIWFQAIARIGSVVRSFL